MDWKAYENAKKRCFPYGRKTVCDADIIMMQEEEIEFYRRRIRELEEHFKDAKEEPLFKTGEMYSVKIGDNVHHYILNEMIITDTDKSLTTIELKGTLLSE